MYPDEYDYVEPCGSCEICGTNLYPDDDYADVDLCDQCSWHMTYLANEGTEDA